MNRYYAIRTEGINGVYSNKEDFDLIKSVYPNCSYKIFSETLEALKWSSSIKIFDGKVTVTDGKISFTNNISKLATSAQNIINSYRKDNSHGILIKTTDNKSYLITLDSVVLIKSLNGYIKKCLSYSNSIDDIHSIEGITIGLKENILHIVQPSLLKYEDIGLMIEKYTLLDKINEPFYVYLDNGFEHSNKKITLFYEQIISIEPYIMSFDSDPDNWYINITNTYIKNKKQA